jgi:transporter family protein
MTFSSWQFWALLSAFFAALTAVFAKVGVENVNSDFATLIRTAIILVVLAAILTLTGQFQPAGSISGKTWLFLLLSGWRPARRGSATSAPSSSARRRRWRRSTS